MPHDLPTGVVQVKKAGRTKSWPGCGETGTSHIAGGNVKWYSHSRKQAGSFLKKLDIYLPSNPASPFLEIYQEK